MYWRHGKRELKKSRESFFHQNGGHILQQKLKGTDVSVGSTVEMFTIEELKKATNNFSQNSVIGKGGFGMVYKGNLTRKAITFPNNQVVAIKKSLKVDKTQVEQFINEIIALSQINNKNVVKILGCCLETEMPLLVYEYISNGTLHEHLHNETKACILTWDVRLRIASEVSEVLAYLYTTISIPIIHRDIKSANILLDDNYTAKVADFGASKLAPIDHERLATTIQGTWGYLDPEYMQSGELTAKSDVYSFGVVLAELLTRKKAISYFRLEDDRNLSFFFLRKLNEGRLSEILDDKLVNGIGDGAKPIVEQLEKVSLVAKRCLEVKADDRTTMKELTASRRE
ncbi:Wall-associated receptor kinase 3 [Bienertia sinuspersici]